MISLKKPASGFMFLVLFTVLSAAINAATEDSLKLEVERYKKEKDDERLGKTWISLGKLYYQDYRDTLAIASVDSAIEAFKRGNSLRNLAIAYNTKGNYVSDIGNNEEALIIYAQAEKVSREIKNDTILCYVLNNTGLVYKDIGKFKEGLEMLYETLEVKEKVGMPDKSIASTLLNIGLLLDNIGKSEDAIKYYDRAYDLKEKIGDKLGMARILANIAVIRKNELKYDEAVDLIERSNAILNENPADDLYYVNYTNLGNLKKKLGDNEAALDYLQKALGMAQKMKNANLIGDANLNIGGYYQDMGDFRKSVSYLGKSLEITEFTKSLEQMRDINLMLSQAYGELDDPKKAYAHLQQSNQYRDSIYKMEEIKAIEELKTQYETERKEKELAQKDAQLSKEQLKVKARTNVMTILGSLVLLLAITGGFFFRQQRLKQEKIKQKADLDLQNERLRISRDLHDHIGAELTMISSSLDKKAYQAENDGEKKEMEEISDYARSAMGQLRETIWAIHGSAISLEDFAAKIREYGNKIAETKSIGLNVVTSGENVQLGPAKTINLYRICQEAINNAVKYSECTEIAVKVGSSNKKLEVEISDNGKGFDVASTKSGYGLQNMKQRAEELGGSFELSSSNDRGAEIKVDVPT